VFDCYVKEKLTKLYGVHSVNARHEDLERERFQKFLFVKNWNLVTIKRNKCSGREEYSVNCVIRNQNEADLKPGKGTRNIQQNKWRIAVGAYVFL
jgi:hypothetical protein